MVMSQGTYTFLACFAGFWLIWAAVVLLCCFCSFLQRRLKSFREEPLTGAESMSCPSQGHPPAHITPAPAEPRETTQLCQPQVCPSQVYQPQLCPSQVCQSQVCQSQVCQSQVCQSQVCQSQVCQSQVCQPQVCQPQVCNLQAVSSTTPLQIPHLLPQANWVTMTTVPDTDVFGNPPCYEEAVLMEDPPPPYSEVLADPRGGTYLKPPCVLHPPAPAHNPTPLHPLFPDTKPLRVFPDRGYSSLIRLPSSQRWDSLGHLLSNMDLGHHQLTPPTAHAGLTVARRDPRTPLELRLQAGYSSLQGRSSHRASRGVHSRGRGFEQSCGLNTALPLLGRTTAV